MGRKTMGQVDCLQFEEGCSAPLCPLDEDSIKDGIWYPDEEVCHRRGAPYWVKRQKAIVKVKALSDKYFTVEMLEAIRQVRKGIEGINPDQPLEQAEEAEGIWIVGKGGGRVIAKKNQKPHRVIAKKRKTLADATMKTPKRRKGVKLD